MDKVLELRAEADRALAASIDAQDKATAESWLDRYALLSQEATDLERTIRH